MAYVFKPTLHCDTDGCDEAREGNPGESAKSMRADLHGEGWRYRRIPGTYRKGDMCPWCIEDAADQDQRTR